MTSYVQMDDAPPVSSTSRKLSSSSTTGPQVHNALGTFNGCFIPCCLNILGIILFQRLAWAIGQAGISGVLLIFLLAESMAILTVLSFSAIVTNGSMRGGGSYFMISRSLGPEFGGAIGLLFYLAYAVGVAFYISGFSLAVRSSFFDTAPEYSTNLYIGTVGLAAVTVIS
jgi:solute carrier family 12 (potassium/chloride transporters), member 9